MKVNQVQPHRGGTKALPRASRTQVSSRSLEAVVPWKSLQSLQVLGEIFLLHPGRHGQPSHGAHFIGFKQSPGRAKGLDSRNVTRQLDRWTVGKGRGALSVSHTQHSQGTAQVPSVQAADSHSGGLARVVAGTGATLPTARCPAAASADLPGGRNAVCCCSCMLARACWY